MLRSNWATSILCLLFHWRAGVLPESLNLLPGTRGVSDWSSGGGRFVLGQRKGACDFRCCFGMTHGGERVTHWRRTRTTNRGAGKFGKSFVQEIAKSICRFISS